MTIFCPECGNKLPSDGQFCANCGFLIEKINHEKGDFIKNLKKSSNTLPRIKKQFQYKIFILGICVMLVTFMYIQYKDVKQAEINAANAVKTATQAQSELNQTKQDNASEQSKIQALLSKNASKPSITDIIEKWHPIIAYVECEYTDSYGETQGQSGSGTLIINENGTRSILTNYHVVSDDKGYIVNNCSIKLPNDTTTYTAYTKDITTTPDSADVAYIKINTPDAYLFDITIQGRNNCTQIPNLGDEIVVLGYPGIGSQTDITATDGIISGYDESYYITSAKVAHGNSGGAAIDVTRNCYLGIPTGVKTDTAESLARILKWQSF